MVSNADGKFFNNPIKRGGKLYDRFLIYVPSELARDSAFPFPWPAPNLSGSYAVTLRIDEQNLVIYDKQPLAPKRPEPLFQLPQPALEQLLSALIDQLLTRDQLQEYVQLVAEEPYPSMSRRFYYDRLDAKFGPHLPAYLRTPLARALEELLDHYLTRYHAAALRAFLAQKLAERPEAGSEG